MEHLDWTDVALAAKIVHFECGSRVMQRSTCMEEGRDFVYTIDGPRIPVAYVERRVRKLHEAAASLGIDYF